MLDDWAGDRGYLMHARRHFVLRGRLRVTSRSRRIPINDPAINKACLPRGISTAAIIPPTPAAIPGATPPAAPAAAGAAIMAARFFKDGPPSFKSPYGATAVPSAPSLEKA